MNAYQTRSISGTQIVCGKNVCGKNVCGKIVCGKIVCGKNVKTIGISKKSNWRSWYKIHDFNKFYEKLPGFPFTIVNKDTDEKKLLGVGLIATCEREEFVIHYDKKRLGEDYVPKEIVNYFEDRSVSLDELKVFHDRDAVRHIFHVAGGYDSEFYGDKRVRDQLIAAKQDTNDAEIKNLLKAAYISLPPVPIINMPDAYKDRFNKNRIDCIVDCIEHVRQDIDRIVSVKNVYNNSYNRCVINLVNLDVKSKEHYHNVANHLSRELENNKPPYVSYKHTCKVVPWCRLDARNCDIAIIVGKRKKHLNHQEMEMLLSSPYTNLPSYVINYSSLHDTRIMRMTGKSDLTHLYREIYKNSHYNYKFYTYVQEVFHEASLESMKGILMAKADEYYNDNWDVDMNVKKETCKQLRKELSTVFKKHRTDKKIQKEIYNTINRYNEK